MKQDKRASIDTLVHQVMQKFSRMKIDENAYSDLSNWVDGFPYLIAPTGICKVERQKKGTESTYWITPVASFLVDVKRLVFLDEPRVDLILQYSDGITIKELQVDREQTLSKPGIKSLLGKGISFNESRCELLLTYLLWSEQRAPKESVHCHLGWVKEKGAYTFRGYESFSAVGSSPSHYVGNLDIKPRGNLDVWLDMVKNNVLPYPQITFCLLLGFAAPVLSRLYLKFDLGSLVFNISNDSSRGKTTAAMLASSVFSCPFLGQGTVRSFHATQNFLTRFLSDVSAFTVVLDEGATYSGDFNQLFYLIAAGEEKGRLEKDGTMKEPLSWNNIVITTAEFLPVKDDSANGIRTRCFNITDNMTEDAAHADRIKATISENYGHAGNRFVQWLLTLSDDDLESDYQFCQQTLHDTLNDAGMTESPFTNRVFSKLAVVLQVADYVYQCLDLDINTKDLIQYIVRIERNVNSSTDSVQRSIDIILAEVSRNSSHYMSKGKFPPENCLGKIDPNGDYKVIAILKAEFNSICKRNSLQPMFVLKSLRERQMLDREGDRLSKRVRLQRNLPEQSCYIIKIYDPNTETRKDFFENE